MSRKHKKLCTTLNYIVHFLILASTITGCKSVSAFPSLIGIPRGITSSEVGLKIYAITAGIKKYKSTIEKNKKKHDKIVLLAKSKLNSMKILISEAFIDSNISHDEFVLMNNVLNKYDEMKEQIKNLRLNQVYRRFYSIHKTMLSYRLKYRKNTEIENLKVTRKKTGSIMLLSKCAVCDSKNSKLIREQKPRGLVSSLRIKTPLSKILLVVPLLF